MINVSSLTLGILLWSIYLFLSFSKCFPHDILGPDRWNPQRHTAGHILDNLELFVNLSDRWWDQIIVFLYFVNYLFWFNVHHSCVIVLSSSAATVLRDASGNLNDSLALNSSILCSGQGCKHGWNFDRCEQNRTCGFGLANNFQVIAAKRHNWLRVGQKTVFKTVNISKCMLNRHK